MGDTASCVCGDGRESGDRDAALPMRPAIMTKRAHSPSAYMKHSPVKSPVGAKRPPPTLEQKAALASLADAVLRENVDMEEVERAMALGRAAGLSEAELDEAREAGLRATSRRRARDALARAMKTREEEELRHAVGLADEALLDQRELEGALALIEELETAGGRQVDSDASKRRALAVARLEAAIKNRGYQQLMEAIQVAERAGLAVKSQRAVLAQARVTLKIVVARRQAAQDRRAQELAADGGAEIEEEGGETPPPK
mmetsp:Transcript_88561/g.247703  ORF Transcript_88561/g.247703 Transcript_88561/m.247703 type:complete len:258 (-) Transcript_88561:25-798(-)